MEFRDYYQSLEIDRKASTEDIEKAFRRLARKYHPDVSKETDAEARFKEINEAYEVLKDPEKRERYDALGSDWKSGFQPPPEWHVREENLGTEDFSEFFRSVFGDFGFPQQRRGRARRGTDRTGRLEVDLEEAIRGADKVVTWQETRKGIDGAPRTTERELKVKIPPGVADGQKIRLAGQGDPGNGRAPAGDLIVELTVRPHPRFEIDGRDLRGRLHLAPWEAALGATVDFRTLEGTVELKIPPGSQTGQILRLRGKGLGQPRGDLLVKIEIVVPEVLSPQEEMLFEALSRESHFRPRERRP